MNRCDNLECQYAYKYASVGFTDPETGERMNLCQGCYLERQSEEDDDAVVN